MFSLHETTRVYACRAAFVALCIVPSCMVLAWCAIVRLPAYTRGHEQAIAAGLGLHAQLGRASSPRPGTMLYQSLELSDPETRQPLARLPLVEVQTVAGIVHVRLPLPAIINGTRLDAFWKAARDRSRPGQGPRHVQFAAQKLTVHLRDGDQSFTDLQGQFESSNELAGFKLRFRRGLPGQKPTDAAELTFTRTRQAQSAGGVFQFTTGASPLPCSLAESIWPGMACLGSASEFQGHILAPEQTGLGTTQISGRLSRLDLERLIGSRFGHKLTGPADVTLAHLAIRDGRIETASGKIAAGPGALSRSLVQSAMAHLHLQTATETKIPSEHVLSYRQMAITFSISPQGLVLGSAALESPGALVVDDQGRMLLRAPSAASQPVVNLVRALVPQSDVQVPATRETAGLLQALPLPSAASGPRGQEPPGQARSPRVNPKRN